ncbi:hypothetical protein Y695_02967 [Hydrogenophaga sp. T4]|nr:hypothetical protein Y695_02967 [Hydrogenophaga sp. T4]
MERWHLCLLPEVVSSDHSSVEPSLEAQTSNVRTQPEATFEVSGAALQRLQSFSRSVEFTRSAAYRSLTRSDLIRQTLAQSEGSNIFPWEKINWKKSKQLDIHRLANSM